MQTKYLVIRRCLKHDEFIKAYDEKNVAELHASLDAGFYVMKVWIND